MKVNSLLLYGIASSALLITNVLGDCDSVSENFSGNDISNIDIVGVTSVELVKKEKSDREGVFLSAEWTGGSLEYTKSGSKVTLKASKGGSNGGNVNKLSTGLMVACGMMMSNSLGTYEQIFGVMAATSAVMVYGDCEGDVKLVIETDKCVEKTSEVGFLIVACENASPTSSPVEATASPTTSPTKEGETASPTASPLKLTSKPTTSPTEEGATKTPTTSPTNSVQDPPPVGQLPLIRQSGKYWAVDGEVIHLRGLNLGNWFQLEMWMMDLKLKNGTESIGDQCALESILDERFGFTERERLMDVFRDSWMTDRDWDNIKSMGFNVVRLPFRHTLIEDENNPFQLRKNAWKYLDNAIKKAADRGMYTILDLHGAAGSQGWEHHSGCSGRNWYWDGNANHTASYYQNRTHWLWEKIAERYNGNGDVAGYGLLNEPWGTQEQILGEQLGELYKSVRKHDKEHIVILHGHHTGIDSFPMPGNDVAYEMHFYPGLWGWRENEDQTTTHSDWLHCKAAGWGNTCDWDGKMTQKQNPFLVGEFQPWTLLGKNKGEITRKTFDIYNEFGWAATAWSYKTIAGSNHTGNSDDGWGWGLFTNTIGINEIDVTTATQTDIENWFKQFQIQTLIPNPDIKTWMEYKQVANAMIHGEHFNRHWGGKMEETQDDTGSDFNYGFLEDGNYMIYTVEIPETGTYKAQYRVASEPGGGKVQLSIDQSTVFGITDIPQTNGWQNWVTIDGPQLVLAKGMVELSLYVPKAGWNLNWWRIDLIEEK